ncbi:MAG: MerR family transcriptional regulator [Pelobium sp.]
MKKFSISDIENLTGIKAHTIRVWEKRYHFFTSKRTQTNIRYYDDVDLCMFLNIATLNENGYKISKISKMDLTEMTNLVKNLKVDDYNINVQLLANAMLKMDEVEFDNLLNSCIKEFGMEKAMSTIVFPFLRKMGFMWQTRAINRAHEYFSTHKIAQKIIQLTSSGHQKKAINPKKFLLFLPKNEHQDIGLLFSQYMIKNSGHQTLYLGQNLPEDTLEEVVLSYKPDYALTVINNHENENNVNSIIQKLKQNLQETPLIVAGNPLYLKNIEKHKNVIVIKNVSEFNEKFIQ